MKDEELKDFPTEKQIDFVIDLKRKITLEKGFCTDADIYLAGLKAGRPQWHDLRENPNALPERYMSIVNQDGEKVMYDCSCKAWRYDDADEYLCDTPIAWCEIPTFDKE